MQPLPGLPLSPAEDGNGHVLEYLEVDPGSDDLRRLDTAALLVD